MNIAIIPARGGSKRILRKNVRPFCGRPMIAWPIDAAAASGLFDHILVSTEDAEIADVARQAGAEVPFARPVELADDHSGTTDVIVHALSWAIEAGWQVEAACCIYATAAFLSAELLVEARRLKPGPERNELRETAKVLRELAKLETSDGIGESFRVDDRW